MRENQVSFTSIMTACIRAYHSQYGEPKIFDDFLAYSLIPEDKRELIEQILPKEALMNSTNAITRARYTEDLLERAVKQGVTQYVILGAGMDTFAFRRPELVEQLQVFEIDHPDTQNFKRERIDELGWDQPKQLHFIPIDFSKDSLEKVLTATPHFYPEQKSFFSWLGVTMYLTKEEVFSTLRSIVNLSNTGNLVVFDYYDTNELIETATLQKKQEMMKNIGEPMKTCFNPSTLCQELSKLGLRLNENLSPEDIEECYFQSGKNNYHAHKNVHFACAVVE